ncbi:ATP-dependent DNA helicase srs2 [Knufia peltigerae]|uniref:DNA 3'-5' helicase n=1 Tax=Knufia peltigerae TaxID=1002370 RepID=A0AA39CLN7_9EURO|nr:ATP-dependent DNA helicase srs2 [Knufia peltigerae]
MDTQLLSGLNTAQRAAVTSKATVLQVLAPPGSGKTKTLTCRVANLIANEGLNPQNVICCTFTIKASREMRERLRDLIGCELEAKLVLGTFHSICRRYLVAYGHLIGIPKGFGIADSSDSLSIIKRIVKRLKLSIEPKAARGKISSHKAKGKKLEALPKTPQKQVERQEFITVFHEYEAALATSKLLDYDDLLLRCVDLLRAFPGCVSNVEALLIDEFQDTNVVQFELMKQLATAARRVTVVGDPDQSIYGFRAAEIENLRRMKAFYPETVVINLEENYRSSSSLLKLAQDVIEQDTDRPQKRLKATHCNGTPPVLRRLPNPNEEALWIASEIKRMATMTGDLLLYWDFAILLRSAYLSLLIERALSNSGIPYRMVGGQRFFDRVEIRIIIDYLRTISHPDNNQALVSIINVPSRKIGETTLAEFMKIGEQRKISLWAVVQRVLVGDIKAEKTSKHAEQEIGRLVALIKNARQKMESMMPATVPSKLIDLVIKSLDLEDYIKKKYKDDHEDRLENIKELITHASEVLLQPSEETLAQVDGVEQQVSDGGQEVLAQFLANIVLSTDTDKSEEGNDQPRVTISTIHSAKGLEWPVVFIPAVYEGSIPHSRAEDNDEERRLLYVAMTRAQALLTLSFPLTQSRDQGDSMLTQFLPPQIHHHLAETGPMFSDKVVRDIASILRRATPSQEALVKGLQSLKANESQSDDVWPTDGSRRAVAMFPSGAQTTTPEFGRPLAEAVAMAKRELHSHKSSFGNNSTSFSTSNVTMGGFKTASDHFRTLPPELTRSSSEALLPPSKKPKLSKSTSAQGNIATFFGKPAGQAQTLPVTECVALTRTSVQPNQERRWPVKSASQSTRLPAELPIDNKPTDIPKEFASHRLNTGNPFAYKRPSTLNKTSNNNNTQSRYANIYGTSSPPPPPPPPPEPEEVKVNLGRNGGPTPQGENQGQEQENRTFVQTKDSRPRSLNPKGNITACSTPRTNYIMTRPAGTMHSTTVSSVRRHGNTGSGGRSEYANSNLKRRTLGVRQGFGGWDARKHK